MECELIIHTIKTYVVTRYSVHQVSTWLSLREESWVKKSVLVTVAAFTVLVVQQYNL